MISIFLRHQTHDLIEKICSGSAVRQLVWMIKVANLEWWSHLYSCFSSDLSHWCQDQIKELMRGDANGA